MSRFIRTPAYPGKMPVDISFVFEDEKPAGKHGFMKPEGDHFVFEDGTPARFWGVNFNGGANFPEHDYAEKVARRLAQSGCNIVRFHQLDAEWDTPNIYQYTKGKRLYTTRKLDPVSMDHLDYLIHCLKEEGIYVYFDMMTYRNFKEGDGFEHSDELGDSAKPYSYFNRRMIDLQKEFCDQIWNRMNPYTGLLYKDDPVFVMTEITNECDMFGAVAAKYGNSEFYNAQYRELFGEWLKKNNIEYDWQNWDRKTTDEVNFAFKMEYSKAYYKEMYDYMRSLGVKIPITGTNWTHAQPGNVMAQEDMDFTDGHHYYYNWGWGEEDKIGDNNQINGKPYIMQNMGIMRQNDKPFFCSEWDMPWPNPYRAEGPIYYAAVTALQNWTGMAIHTYAYDTNKSQYDIIGKEVSSSTIGGVPYREGIFAVWNDPCKFGLFYHAALIVRRADITPANKKIGATIANKFKIVANAFATGLEQHQIQTVLEGHSTEGLDQVISGADTIESVSGDPNLIVSDNGQMWRNLKAKVGAIDTPRTKVIYGTLREGRFPDAPSPLTHVDGFSVVSGSQFAVIALSSLTNDPIEDSDNMLLTTVSRAQNTGMAFDGDKLTEYGAAPILSEVVKADLKIRVKNPNLKVWGVNAEGYYTGKVPTTYEDGCLCFTVGETMMSSYYLIVGD